MRKGLQDYKQLQAQTSITDADPHRIIDLLISGCLDKLAIAKGCIERVDFEGKGKALNLAISIIASLQASLDKKSGGELAENLDRLYDYMSRRLFLASSEMKVQYVEEVQQLLLEIKEAWNGIRPAIENPVEQKAEKNV